MDISKEILLIILKPRDNVEISKKSGLPQKRLFQRYYVAKLAFSDISNVYQYSNNLIFCLVTTLPQNIKFKKLTVTFNCYSQF
jgi:hypothetical protein